jgi:hypothetical protein
MKPPDVPPIRPRARESARLAADVEAYLARGGAIHTYPTGQSGEPYIGSLAALVKHETDAAKARAHIERTRRRGTKRGAESLRRGRGGLPQSGA